jgi:16S rRNA (cytosine967-C5)-methyltransferase
VARAHRPSGLDPVAPPAHRAADLLLVEGLTLRDVEAMFDGGRDRPAPLDDAELRALRQMEGHSLPHPEQPDWVRINVQDWVSPHLIEAYGESWGREIAALETPPPVDLRVNQLKATVEQAQAALAREGIDTEPMRYAPHGLRLKRSLSVVSGEAFQNGLVEIQVEGSQLVAARWSTAGPACRSWIIAPARAARYWPSPPA